MAMTVVGDNGVVCNNGNVGKVMVVVTVLIVIVVVVSMGMMT